MARTESGKKVMGWATAAVLLATAPLMAACSGASDGGSGSGSGTSDNSGASSDKGSGAKAGDSSGAQASGRSTVPSAVGDWVSAVIAKDAKQACLLSAPSGNSKLPKAGTPQTCDASLTKKMAPGVKSMSKAFAPQNASDKPTVKVDAPTPDGDKATVPTAKINVDGKPLRDIILSGSHGIDEKSFTAKVQAAKIDGKWYVGDFDIDIGGKQTLQPKDPKSSS
ncbi:hypothetical protein ACWFRJ_28955 [Streptomyces sp. NPDC055239]